MFMTLLVCGRFSYVLMKSLREVTRLLYLKEGVMEQNDEEMASFQLLLTIPQVAQALNLGRTNCFGGAQSASLATVGDEAEGGATVEGT
jgi:hypothetical protein